MTENPVPDFSALARRPSERLVIVEYILETPGLQETDYLEWKTSYDLSTRPGAASTAKQLIGMANRDAERASRHAEGYAYVLLGVEPENLVGVAQWDSANIESWLTPFVGPNLRYDIHYVRKDNKEVLFLTIDPARQGDPIYCFRESSEDLSTKKTIPEAAIFVRHGSKTEPPTAEDLDRLGARTAAPGIDASIRDVSLIVGTNDVAIINQNMFTTERRTEWGRARRRRLLARVSSDGVSSITLKVMGEKRSSDEYVSEVHAYISRFSDAETWTRTVMYEALGTERSQLHLSIDNRSPENYEDAVVEVNFIGLGRANIYASVPEADEILEIPEPPDEWGEPDYTRLLDRSMPALKPRSEPDVEEVGAGEVLVRYPEFRVRPLTPHKLPSLFLVLPPHFAGTSVQMHWRMTASNVKGEFSEDLELNLPPDPVAAREKHDAESAS
jgi:hypothetical protein